MVKIKQPTNEIIFKTLFQFKYSREEHFKLLRHGTKQSHTHFSIPFQTKLKDCKTSQVIKENDKPSKQSHKTRLEILKKMAARII